MATSPELAEYIVDQLAGAGSITHRKMFGGVGIYIDDVFCAIISSKNTFFMRVGPINIDDFKNAGMRQFPGGKGAGMPYFEVPEEVLEDRETLAKWALKAKQAAISAKR